MIYISDNAARNSWSWHFFTCSSEIYLQVDVRRLEDTILHQHHICESSPWPTVKMEGAILVYFGYTWPGIYINSHQTDSDFHKRTPSLHRRDIKQCTQFIWIHFIWYLGRKLHTNCNFHQKTLFQDLQDIFISNHHLWCYRS